MTNQWDDFLESVIKDKRMLRSLFTEDPEGCCVSDEQITELLEHQLPSDNDESIFSHIAFCDTCFEIFTTSYKLKKEFSMEGTFKKNVSLMDTVSKEASRLKITIKNFKKSIIPFVFDSGFIPAPVPAALMVRSEGGEGDESQQELVRFSKDFGHISLGLEVQRRDGKSFTLSFLLTEKKSGAPMENILINLMLGNREVESSTTREGTVVFDELALEEYRVLIFEEKNKKFEFDLSFV